MRAIALTAACLIATSAHAYDETRARVALTIYAESAGEPQSGRAAVASVIYNRARDRMTRNRATWRAALMATCQAPAFSCWSARRIMRPNMRRQADREAWWQCWLLANSITRMDFSPTVSARHYAEYRVRNYWTRAMVADCRIGGHVFYTKGDM